MENGDARQRHHGSQTEGPRLRTRPDEARQKYDEFPSLGHSVTVRRQRGSAYALLRGNDPVAQVKSSADRRCCRIRNLHRLQRGSSIHQGRCQADREWRCGIPFDLNDETPPSGQDSGAQLLRDPAEPLSMIRKLPRPQTSAAAFRPVASHWPAACAPLFPTVPGSSSHPTGQEHLIQGLPFEASCYGR